MIAVHSVIEVRFPFKGETIGAEFGFQEHMLGLEHLIPPEGWPEGMQFPGERSHPHAPDRSW